MELSVIIPTLNRLDTLASCIDSVIENTPVELEIIVYANCCDDTTATYLDSMPQVVAIKDEENKFFTEAVNLAIKLSKGNHILLLNDDCVIRDNNWFPVYKRMLDQDPRIAAVGPHWHNIPELPFGWIELYAALYPRYCFQRVGLLPYHDPSFVLWWSDIYHAYTAMHTGHYILPVDPAFLDGLIHHRRPVGDYGDTVKMFQQCLPPECFEFHGKELMYQRIGIDDEDKLQGYYMNKVWTAADYEQIGSSV